MLSSSSSIRQQQSFTTNPRIRNVPITTKESKNQLKTTMKRKHSSTSNNQFSNSRNRDKKDNTSHDHTRNHDNNNNNNNRWKMMTATSIITTIPIIIWIRDCFFSLYRVQGTSMEPTLYHNDIILVRKCDYGIITETLWDYLSSFLPTSFFTIPSSSQRNNKNDNIAEQQPQHHHPNDTKENKNKKFPYLSTKYIMSNEEERQQMIRYEYFYGPMVPQQQPTQQQHIHHRARFYEIPPMALPGHVIVFYHPHQKAYPPTELSMKRIIGIGGQLVQIYHPRKKQNNTIENHQENAKADDHVDTVISDHEINKPDETKTIDSNRSQRHHRDDDHNIIPHVIASQENHEATAATTPPSSSNTPATTPTTSTTTTTISSKITKRPRNTKPRFTGTDDMGYYTIELLPSYTYYVEGDNHDTTYHYDEPILKHSLIGIAEYVIWPPSHFRRIIRQNSVDPITHEPRNRWL